MNQHAVTVRQVARPQTFLLVLAVLSAAACAQDAEPLDTHVLFSQDFEQAAGEEPPWPVRDNSGWAGASVPVRVVDSGDPRYGKLLECEVSGFCQIILGQLKGIRKGAVYRVTMDLSTTGGQTPVVFLRRGRSPYTVYISSEERTNESMRRVSFLGKSMHSVEETVLLMLILKGVTTLRADNILVEEVLGNVPEGAPPVPGNLVLNAGFELGRDGWFVRGPVEFGERADAFEGSWAPRLAHGGLLTSAWLRLSMHSDYLVTARVKAEAGSAKVALGMGDYIFPRGGSSGKSESCEIKHNDGWKRVGFRWRPPASGGKITRWAEFYVSLRNVGASDSVLSVDAVEVKALIPGTVLDQFVPAARSELAVMTDAPQNVATRGDPVTVTVRSTVELQTTALHILYEDDRLFRAVPVRLDGRQTVVRLDDLPCGYWRLVTVTPPSRTAEKHIEGESLLAVVPPMPALAVERWAYGCHVPVNDAVRRACWRLGLRWNRFHDTCKATKWPTVQPDGRKWVFDDERVGQHLSAGHGLAGSLAGLPGWVPRTLKERQDGKPVAAKASRSNWGMIAETFPLWEEYARRCAEHWRGRIDVWEVTNEPNLSGMSPTDYMRILESACRGVKRGNPEALVVGLGGATPIGSRWIIETIAAGAAKHADVISFHGYGSTTWTCNAGPQRLCADVGRIRAALAQAGAPDMPLWDSECGVTVRTSLRKFHVPHGGSAGAAAQMFPKSVAAVKAAGIQRVFYYSAHETTHAGDAGLRWLCDFNGVVKRPAVPLAVAISMLVDARYVGQAATAAENGIVTLDFRRAHDTVRMAWTLQGTARLDVPETCLDIITMWGRPLTDSRPGMLTLTTDPVYLLLGKTQ